MGSFFLALRHELCCVVATRDNYVRCVSRRHCAVCLEKTRWTRLCSGRVRLPTNWRGLHGPEITGLTQNKANNHKGHSRQRFVEKHCRNVIKINFEFGAFGHRWYHVISPMLVPKITTVCFNREATRGTYASETTPLLAQCLVAYLAPSH